ncbi:hypothetical protein TRAPUB_9536 [Trametes pubescens]|uniref:Uncharacterized protein n=1 Tax=Trametes pubescens TaxID=154538 RepID=A0A1M2W209_TRAPU|nr:hypothetical protein TRAPUB_9536 [Trametes pubescens]
MGTVHSRATPSFEDVDGHTPLPPKPFSVCQSCWEGPFAIQLGLASREVSESNKQRDRSCSYLTFFEKLQTRALAGCVWCQLLIAVWTTRPTNASGASSDGLLNVTVRGSIETQASWNPGHIQCINVTINGFSLFKGLVHADPGMYAYTAISGQSGN